MVSQRKVGSGLMFFAKSGIRMILIISDRYRYRLLISDHCSVAALF